MSSLSGKVALITGGSSGIGLATTKLFLEHGAFVFITGRRETELQNALRDLGANASAVQGDIGSTHDLDKLFAHIKETKGRIDILFANAGVGDFAPLGMITEEHFDRLFTVNVRGTVFTVQKALELMPNGSSIILNTSIASTKGMPAFSVYAATKAALRSFARGWASDLKGRGIRVNVVSPGTIPTHAYGNLGLTETQMTAFLESQSNAIPLGRVGATSELANAVLFLASSQSSYVNASELVVDGGLSQI